MVLWRVFLVVGVVLFLWYMGLCGVWVRCDFKVVKRLVVFLFIVVWFWFDEFLKEVIDIGVLFILFDEEVLGLLLVFLCWVLDLFFLNCFLVLCLLEGFLFWFFLCLFLLDVFFLFWSLFWCWLVGWDFCEVCLLFLLGCFEVFLDVVVGVVIVGILLEGFLEWL